MRGEGDKEDRGVYGTGERVRGGDYFGHTTPSYDLETSFDGEFSYEQVDRACLERAVQQFIGEIEQFPPSYSAVRVDGVRAYEMARRGDEVEMKSRKVMVREIEILKAEFPIVELRIVCSKERTSVRWLMFGKSLREWFAFVSSKKNPCRGLPGGRWV